MSTDTPRKIFLSHKNSDKPRVLDFKKTLDLLGYETWLDDEDMPAGTSPERGLLRGMKESCGVVFFITPSFKDEGYLADEIEYAVREKRERGKRFSIITLQFTDEGGKKAPIPELLKRYVWKTPKTHLEALREIIRALPVAPGNVEWRGEVATVATGPQVPSRTAELSDEAKTILREAASRNGMIVNEPGLDNHYIFARKKQLIPNQEPRTLARWKGGLNQLRRCEYIERIGAESEVFDPRCEDIRPEGEVFKVTSDGYEAADEMLEA